MTLLLLLSLGVAVDAAAVAGGLALRGATTREVWKLAVTFGLFQFGMALAGALGGTVLQTHLASVDHWVAFGLLAFVGGKMIYEAFAQPEGGPVPVLSGVTLLGLGVATSLDALAVGVTLPTLELGRFFPPVMIGLVTMGLSLVGAYVGRRMGLRFGRSLEIVGGLVLVGIGVKTLIEHLGATVG